MNTTQVTQVNFPTHEVIVYDFKNNTATVAFQGSKDACIDYSEYHNGVVSKII